MNSTLKLVCYKVVIATRYAAERAYHELKADKDCRQLFSLVKLDSQAQVSYYVQSPDDAGKHHQYVSPSVISMHFRPEHQQNVKKMLAEKGKDLYHLQGDTKITRIDVERTEQDLLLIDFTK